MGSISKYKHGYRAFARVNNKRKTKVFGRKSDARAWIEITEERLALNEYSFHSALDRYESSVSVNKKGYRWEKTRLNNFKKQIKDQPIRDITRPIIADWRDMRLKSVSPSTVRREFNLLSAIFNAALYEWEWIKESPCKGVRRPQNPPPRDRVFAPDEIESVCDALYVGVKGQEIKTVFLIALETGMRAGEILNIQPKHIKGRVLDVPETKTGKPRQVPLSAKALELVKQAPFTISGDSLSVQFRRALHRAGVDNATFHDARHTAITRLSKIFNPMELARIVGHSNLNQLMTYYNPTTEDLADRL